MFEIGKLQCSLPTAVLAIDFDYNFLRGGHGVNFQASRPHFRGKAKILPGLVGREPDLRFEADTVRAKDRRVPIDTQSITRRLRRSAVRRVISDNLWFNAWAALPTVAVHWQKPVFLS